MHKIALFMDRLFGDVSTVFYFSALIIAGFVGLAAAYPADVERIAQLVLDFTANKMGWMYLVATTGFVIFMLFLGLSRFGNVRLGPDEEPPEFSFKSWLAMIFSSGMGVGLVFWGVAEPMMHFNEPPLGLSSPLSVEAAQMGELSRVFRRIRPPVVSGPSKGLR